MKDPRICEVLWNDLLMKGIAGATTELVRGVSSVMALTRPRMDHLRSSLKFLSRGQP